MVTVVIGINLLITVLCLYAAWQVWKLQKILARAADALTTAERCTHAVLAGAPTAIARGQVSTNRLRQQYHQVELQLLKAQQILALTGLSRFVWQWYTRHFFQRRAALAQSSIESQVTSKVESNARSPQRSKR